MATVVEAMTPIDSPAAHVHGPVFLKLRLKLKKTLIDNIYSIFVVNKWEVLVSLYTHFYGSTVA